MNLYAPKEYWEDLKSFEKLINGCGPRGIIGLIIPDNILGVNIKKACDIHDYMYIMGETIEDKDKADRVFLNNMIRLIGLKSTNNLILKMRLFLAKKYYQSVCTFGGVYFWDKKNKDENIG